MQLPPPASQIGKKRKYCAICVSSGAAVWSYAPGIFLAHEGPWVTGTALHGTWLLVGVSLQGGASCKDWLARSALIHHSQIGHGTHEPQPPRAVHDSRKWTPRTHRIASLLSPSHTPGSAVGRPAWAPRGTTEIGGGGCQGQRTAPLLPAACAAGSIPCKASSTRGTASLWHTQEGTPQRTAPAKQGRKGRKG
eukprot:487850-Pelagomonas_calceolata.AAC.9